MKKKNNERVTKFWLKPIPEKKYIRVVFVGMMQLAAVKKKDSSAAKSELEELIWGIWKVSSRHNKENCIAGHLAFTKSLHVAQLLEGEEEVVLDLMKRIRGDPRVIIYKEFSKYILTMNLGWDISLCYSFHITNAEMGLINNKNMTLEKMFELMYSTFLVKEHGQKHSKFYRDTIELFLLKYISIDQEDILNVPYV